MKNTLVALSVLVAFPLFAGKSLSLPDLHGEARPAGNHTQKPQPDANGGAIGTEVAPDEGKARAFAGIKMVPLCTGTVAFKDGVVETLDTALLDTSTSTFNVPPSMASARMSETHLELNISHNAKNDGSREITLVEFGSEVVPNEDHVYAIPADNHFLMELKSKDPKIKLYTVDCKLVPEEKKNQHLLASQLAKLEAYLNKKGAISIQAEHKFFQDLAQIYRSLQELEEGVDKKPFETRFKKLIDTLAKDPKHRFLSEFGVSVMQEGNPDAVSLYQDSLAIKEALQELQAAPKKVPPQKLRSESLNYADRTVSRLTPQIARKKNETPPLPLANRFEETFKALATELQDIQSFAQKHPDKVEPESAPIALSELTHVTGTPLLKPLK